MSEAYAYNPPRKTPAFNYGGDRWKLSRSKISGYVKCPKCSYLDNVLGLAQPFGFPFNLNEAIDSALKNESNYIRKQLQAGHTLPFPQAMETMPTSLELVMEQNQMRPFIHPDVPQWQKKFGGVEHFHKPTGMPLSGMLDDVWTTVDPKDDTLFVVDYKGTAKAEMPKDLKSLIYDDYRQQLEIYQYLLRKNGFNVSSKGYFIYAIANKNPENLNYYLELEIALIECVGDDSWIEDKLKEIKGCFDRPRSEAINIRSGDDCNFCKYRGAFRKL